MQDDSLVGSICDKTGISKRSIGLLTGIHHSMLVRYHAGTHSLPVKAWPALLQLYTAVKNTRGSAAPVPSAEDIKALQEQAQWCLAQCYPLRKKLAAMQQLYKQGATTLQLLDAHCNTELSNPRQQRRHTWPACKSFSGTVATTATGNFFRSVSPLKFKSSQPDLQHGFAAKLWVRAIPESCLNLYPASQSSEAYFK